MVHIVMQSHACASQTYTNNLPQTGPILGMIPKCDRNRASLKEDPAQHPITSHRLFNMLQLTKWVQRTLRRRPATVGPFSLRSQLNMPPCLADSPSKKCPSKKTSRRWWDFYDINLHANSTLHRTSPSTLHSHTTRTRTT
jgi:hypothetical protein